MFKTFSLTQAANYASVLVVLAGMLDINLPYTEAEALVYGVGLLVLIVVKLFGRFRVGDISALGFRK